MVPVVDGAAVMLTDAMTGGIPARSRQVITPIRMFRFLHKY
jgi:hypothetical protein